MDHDIVTTFVQDTIDELEQRNALDGAEYLRMMLECDGPDVVNARLPRSMDFRGSSYSSS